MNYRKEIIDRLIPFFDKDERYILLVCDMGFGVIDRIKERYPKRVYNMGIMEQGTIGIAAGLALGGLIPIVYSIVNFICFRALEQVRNDIVLQGLNVKLIGTGAEDYFKFLGHSHTCGQDDIKIMELVGMPVFNPYGGSPFGGMVKEWMESDKAGYLRV
ncbi:MAG: hypothetical protein H7831_06850 [Magnetococcus sp. WYHC-3]